MIPIPSDTSWPGFDALKAWLKRQTISFSKVVTGTLNVDQVMQSSNYASGTSGWMVDGAGDAEFNDVTVRGNIISSNWNGGDGVPGGGDPTATLGFYLDSAVGRAQFRDLYAFGGEIKAEVGDFTTLTGYAATITTDMQVGDNLAVGGDLTLGGVKFYQTAPVGPQPNTTYQTTAWLSEEETGTPVEAAYIKSTVYKDLQLPSVMTCWEATAGSSSLKFDWVSGDTFDTSLSSSGSLSLSGTNLYVSSTHTQFLKCPVQAGTVGYGGSLLELWPEGRIGGSYRHYSFRRSAAHATLELYGVTAADVSSLVWSATESGTFHIGQLGSATNPAVSSDADRNTGFYWDGSDGFYFATGGTAAGWISSAQDWRIGHAGTTGKAIIRSTANLGSAPNYTWEGSLDDGMFLIADSRVGIAIGGTTRLETNSSGISVTGRVDASTAARSDVFEFASDTDTQISYSSSGVGNFYSNGTIVGQWGSAGLFSGTLTTSNSPNVYMSSSSVSAHYRFTSAAKYKTNISDAQNYLASLNLRPVKFFRPDDGQWHYGFIADELAAQDKLLGVYDDDGEVESYDWMEVLAVMAAKINQATTTIVELEKRISQLEKESK